MKELPQPKDVMTEAEMNCFTPDFYTGWDMAMEEAQKVLARLARRWRALSGDMRYAQWTYAAYQQCAAELISLCKGK